MGINDIKFIHLVQVEGGFNLLPCPHCRLLQLLNLYLEPRIPTDLLNAHAWESVLSWFLSKLKCMKFLWYYFSSGTGKWNLVLVCGEFHGVPLNSTLNGQNCNLLGTISYFL